MIDPPKLAKLIQRLECLASRLSGRHDLAIHARMNEYDYMQKIEEMKILISLYEESQQRSETVASLIRERYTDNFHRWRKDIRWLNTYLRNKEDFKPIL
jgi:hypothetical protein